ncbi:MAG: nucleotidyltransferase family protein [Anaerolineae bacterium]|nr:nucleotidyltransferase family protein [Anaerolineae bacterium]
MSEPPLMTVSRLVSGQGSPHDIPDSRWSQIVECAIQNGLGPMLLWTLKQADYSIQHIPALRPLVESAHQSAMTVALQERAQHDVNAALNAAGIPALWLKGAALARSVYPEPALRPMGDLDVLVPYDRREEALAVVQAQGFDFTMIESLKWRSTGDELMLKLNPHHYHLRGGVGGQVILELHCRLLGGDDSLLSLEQLAWFWSQTQTLRLDDGTAFDGLTPEAHLLYLAAHAIVQHGEDNVYLLRYFDLHRLITQHRLDWDTVIDQAVVLEWTFVVERALRHAVAYFATPVPGAIFEQLVSRRPAHEDIARVQRLQGHGSRWERVRRKSSSLSAQEKRRFVFQVLFPTRAYMRKRYRVRPGWPVWPYYVYRWWDQGTDMLWSIGKRLSGRYK